jgi:hypothetical protein
MIKNGRFSSYTICGKMLEAIKCKLTVHMGKGSSYIRKKYAAYVLRSKLGLSKSPFFNSEELFGFPMVRTHLTICKPFETIPT